MLQSFLFGFAGDLDAPFAVVPVIAQAGTALAPLLALAVTSTLGLLMRPKDLLKTIKSKPWILLIVLAVVGVLWWLVVWLMAPPAVAARPERAGATAVASANPYQTDWAEVALALIRQHEEAATAPPAPGTGAAVPPAGTVPLPAPLPAPAPAPLPAPTSPAAALFFRGDVHRSGYLGGPSPVGLKPAWSYYAQDERNAMVLSSPMVRDGLVYTASCLIDPPGSYGSVACVELATGKERWLTVAKSATGKEELTGFFSSPALTADGSRLLIGQGLHTDYDACLVCLDARTGAVLWTVPTPLHLECSPSIEGDIVVVGAGAVEVGESHQPVGDPQGHGNPGFVLGVRISTGEVLFRQPVNDPEGSPILEHGICYIGSGMNGSKAVAFRADLSDAELQAKGLGRMLWSIDTPYPATGAVTLAGDSVLIGCGKGDFVFAAKDPEGVVLAIDKRTGAKQWSVTVPDAVLGAIAVAGTTAIVPCRNGEVVAIDLAAQGAVRWRARVNKTAPVLAGPAITGSHVYAVSNDGYLAVFDVADGRQVERVYLNAKGRPGELGLCTSSPLIVDGRVLVGSETGGLRCFIGGAP